jgi:hypothetical protein
MVLMLVSLRLAAGEAAPEGEGFTVHEWGVFTHYSSQPFANAARDAAWKELPKEVYGVTPGRDFPKHCLGADKPIIYFYNTNSLPEKPHGRTVDVRVNFPGGAPLVWHPKTAEPMGGYWGSGKNPNFVGETTSVNSAPDHLRWTICFPQKAQAGNLSCPNYTWKDEALAPAADPFCENAWDKGDVFKFLFYEGMVPSLNGVQLRVEKTEKGLRFLLGSVATFSALDLWVIERTGETLKIARMPKLDPAKAVRDLPESEVKAEEFKEGADGAAKKLVEELIAAGLNKDEASGLAGIWKKEFFETPGVHMLFRLPQAEYDRMLPLTVKPEPKKTARVGLAWFPHLEPDLAERVAEEVKKLNDENFEVREKAFRVLGGPRSHRTPQAASRRLYPRSGPTLGGLETPAGKDAALRFTCGDARR